MARRITFISFSKYFQSQDAGHYHKDAGKQNPDQEYRLVEALRLYSEASRVASNYTYERGDSMQLVKVITGVAEVILYDIASLNRCKKESRQWKYRENAVAAGTWLMAFYDSLLLWEERQQGGSGRTFVEILNSSHDCSIGNIMQLFPIDVRCDIINSLFNKDLDESDANNASQKEDETAAITQINLKYFKDPRSKRMKKEAPLITALTRSKVSIREMELTIPITFPKSSKDDYGSNRRSKRTRRT